MINLKGKKVTVIGASKSGQALTKMIVRCAGLAKLSDKGANNLSENFRKWASENNVALEFDGHTQGFIEDSDLVVVSPGVPFNAQPLEWARIKKIPVLGEIEFAFQFCPIPIIALTGSNGKTTSVTLISEVINASGKKACLCGNIGVPFSEVVLDLKGYDYVVLEVSSFQLETIQKFKPHVAVFLNFNQNHLDRHKDMDEYFYFKSRIFENQGKEDFAILNQQDERIRNLESQVKSKVLFFNDGALNPNHQAVVAVAKALGISADICFKVFKDFKGVEHRLELVRSLNGIDFINDSKATTAESARWAMNSISKPIIMICGGRDKNIDFSSLREIVKKKIKKMIVIGEAKEKIKNVFKDVVDVKEAVSMEDAVLKAQELAIPGDCVLLSPMCASFDMFKDYEDRGRVFKQIVQQLVPKIPQSNYA